MKKIILLLLVFIVPATGFATKIETDDGQEIVVPVEPDGITIQLPDFVRVVTPPQSFHIKPVGGNQDVRVFTIRQIKPGASEKVTFLMNKKTITISLVPGLAGGDNFFDIRWINKKKNRDRNSFLASEQQLMLAMLRDYPTMNRKVVSAKVDMEKYPQLDVNLVRIFQFNGLLGYVFTFRNSTRKTLEVNPTVLAIGSPNQAILTQMDHSVLKSCSDDNSQDPRGTGCVSAVRIVARQSATAPSLTTKTEMPFILKNGGK